MRRRLPPLNSLKAFEAAARLGSLARAADELCVTRGAIGQQIKTLEDFLGVELFIRTSHRISLAPAGQSLLPVATYALDAIAAEAGKLRKSGLQGRLEVATAPAFGSKWLLFHLEEFLQLHPEIDVRLQTLPVYSGQLPAECDIAIAYGLGDWPGHRIHRLGQTHYAPICSPRLLSSAAKVVSTPQDLEGLRLIHDDDGTRWRHWLNAAAVIGINPRKGLFVDNFVYAIDAALAGLGVILADPITIGAQLRAGTLLRILECAYPDRGFYSIVIPEAKEENALVQAFFQWLTSNPEMSSITVSENAWSLALAG